MTKVLALDIGGTNIRSAMVEGTRITDYRKEPMPHGKAAALQKIKETVESYDWRKGICVSIAGFEKNGVLQNSPNTGLEGIGITRFLKSHFRTRVFLDNDANCAGLAELHYGAGRGRKNFVLLTLGTGIGGAIVIDGKLYRGGGGAGQIGTNVMFDGMDFEHHASGAASVRLAHERGFKGITSLELEQKAKEGNKKALEVYGMIGTYLGIGLANVSLIFDPEVLIIGGGFARVKFIFPPARAALRKYYRPNPKPEILRAKFGDDAGLIGAATLAMK